MQWAEIIAQIDAELGRLQSARDFLARVPTTPALLPERRQRKKPPSGRNKPATKVADATANRARGSEEAKFAASAPAMTELNEGPPIQRLPPKRQISRRKSHWSVNAEASTPAALSGSVPSGPIVVSAAEVRKAQEQAANAPAVQVDVEISLNTSQERSLGALVQAFERSARLSRAGTP